MYASRNEYDRGITTFSPEGRLFQVEYALAGVSLGSTALGIRTAEGTVICTEKRTTSKLMEETDDLRKIAVVSDHIACASAGIIADARMLIEHARVEAANHWFTYDEPMPVEACVNSIAELCLDYSGINDNKKAMARPFGVSLLVTGYTPEEGPCLYTADPSGTVVSWKAVAIGGGHEGATAQLEEGYKPDLPLDKALILALSVLRQVMEDKMTPTSVEVCLTRTETGRVEFLDAQQLVDLLAQLPELSTYEAARAHIY